MFSIGAAPTARLAQRRQQCCFRNRRILAKLGDSERTFLYRTGLWALLRMVTCKTTHCNAAISQGWPNRGSGISQCSTTPGVHWCHPYSPLLRMNSACHCTADDSEESDERQEPLTAEELDSMAKKLISEDPKAREILSNVSKAAERVVWAEKAKEALDQQIYEMVANKDRNTASQQMEIKSAEAEVLASEKLMQAASLEATAAKEQQQQYNELLRLNVERAESVKAGLVAATGGGIALLPILISSNVPWEMSIPSLLAGLGSCALFGVTYRYAVRQDIKNVQLKSGVVAAFTLVRVLGQTDALRLLAVQGGDYEWGFDILGPLFLLGGESMLLFAFGTVGLEVALKAGFVKPFGANAEDDGE